MRIPSYHEWHAQTCKTYGDAVKIQIPEDEWHDIMMRSIGMEPDELTQREKWLILLRMVPLVENNFNLCELGVHALKCALILKSRCR